MGMRIMGIRFAAIGVLLCVIAIQAHAATITVTNTNDSGPGSLRQALANANNGDRINFAITGTITLTSGGLPVTKNVTISGPGANQLSIAGNQATFVFGVYPQRTVGISGLSIRNAQVGVYNNQGTLSVSNCVLSGNSSVGLYNAGQGSGGVSMAVANSIISNNSFGLFNDAGQGSGGASMTVANSFIGNNSEGALNLFPPQFPLSASNTLARNSADQSSGDVPCACMAITDSVVSDNNRGISNSGSAFSNGTARLTVVNSNVSGNSIAGISNEGTQGSATATIDNSDVSNNDGVGISNNAADGGAIATIDSTTVSGNSAGGILTSGPGFFGFARITVTDSTISGNSADSGGGIHNSSSNVTILNSTLSGNSAAESGGGIYGGGTIVNSTISDNSAGVAGGGIWGGGEIRNCTLSGNSAGLGGGIYNVYDLEISNTILNGGASGENIFNDGGTVTSHGYNLSSDDGGGYLTGPGDQINTDPLLGPLQNNGGPTLTHALLPGSPAIDAGDPNFAPPPFNDQRGRCFDRVFNGRFNGRIDVGSFEVQPQPRCPTPRPRPTPH
jgi:predicted outer membrane repeat protein